MTESWNIVHSWINHGEKRKSGSSTCCSSFYLVWITRPWHLLELFMLPRVALCLLLLKEAIATISAGISHSLMAFSSSQWHEIVWVWRQADVSRVIAGGLELLTRWFQKKSVFKAKFNSNYINLEKKGYVAFRSVSPLDHTCMCLEWTGFFHRASFLF